MDISFMTSAGEESNWSLDECATWAKENDFDCVRLADRGALDSQKVLDGGAAEVLQTLKSRGVYLSCITAHHNLLDDDEQAAHAEQKKLIQAIESARALDCPVIITSSGSPVRNGQFYGMFSSPPGNPSDRSDELVERFKVMFEPVIKVAEDNDIKVSLDVAVRMGQIGCNPEMWEKLLDAVPSDHLGLSCDPSHWLWMGILPVEDAIRDFAGKWYFADVKDCEISERMRYRQGIIGNWWWQYRVPGRGQLNWSTIIGALWESGYDYVLCVENEDRGFPGLEGFAYGCKHLRQLLPPKETQYQRTGAHWKTSGWEQKGQ
jgi:sugar phosphate isomerase/epimerase